MATKSERVSLRALLCLALLLLASTSLSGCIYGVLYTDTVQPLTENASGNRVGGVAARGSTKEIKEPLTGRGLRVQWASRGIGDVAKANGLTSVSHADIRRESYLAGIWKRYTVYVYGERAETSKPKSE